MVVRFGAGFELGPDFAVAGVEDFDCDLKGIAYACGVVERGVDGDVSGGLGRGELWLYVYSLEGDGRNNFTGCLFPAFLVKGS